MFLNPVMLSIVQQEKSTNSILSFAPFVAHLNQCIQHSTHPNEQLILTKSAFDAAFPDGNYQIPNDKINDYGALYHLVYQLMTSPMTDENSYSWGMGNPFSSLVVYGTNALKNLLDDASHKEFVQIANFKRNCSLAELEAKQVVIYAFLIKRLYNINIFHSTNLVFKILDKECERYFQVDFDDRFIQIEYDGKLPSIDKTITELENFSKEETLKMLQKQIPLEKFTFTGFSILKTKDVTQDILKEQLRDIILTSDLNQDTQANITRIVRRLSNCPHLDLLLLPIFYLNNRIVTEVWQTTFPNLSATLAQYQLTIDSFNEVLNRYVENPRLIFRESIQQNKAKNEDFAILAESGILEGLIIKPIFSKNNLVGIILIASPQKDAISDLILTQMEGAMPLIQNLFEYAVRGFRSTLDKVIKNKFTSIQNSVEWKFNDIALQYLKDKVVEPHPSLLPIRFDNIYPIYGAIDFRNSTLERNQVQKEDWLLQLEALIATIKEIQKIVSLELLGEWKFRARKLIELIEGGVDANTEYVVSHFLEKESIDMLQQLLPMDMGISKIVETYINRTKPDGVFHRNSNALEKTFKILNSNIASILDQMNDKLQEIYPCYFERYRTDGIEFNIYIGQSITPNILFNKLYLKNVQLWQLNTMALIAKITEKSQKELPRKIHTTQLIFIHSNTITTSFRVDERRFDVEGGYNIRYEIIKKRIDKATIKGTGERLTQPGKIAIVYFQKKDAEDYLVHISYLQQMNILSNEIEELELEEMQGVSGLKALRIGIGAGEQPVLENSNPSFLLENAIQNSINTPLKH